MINFFSRKKEPPPPPTEIGASTSFEGDMESKREIIIRGSVKGSAKSDKDIETMEGSVFEGSVFARLVRIEGSFDGSARAATTLHIGAGASASGEFKAARLRIDKGAYVSGKTAS